MFFSAWAAAIVLISKKTSFDMAIGSTLMTVGGVVLGLVITFRTSSAYERYTDGSKFWTNISTASKTMAQQIWIHVPEDRVLPGEKEPTPVLNVIIEKKTMINLVHALAVSVKHLLRDEPGVFYEDIYQSVAFLPKYPTEKRRAGDILPLWHVQPGRRLTPAALKRRDTLFGMVNSRFPPLKPASLPPADSIFDHLTFLRIPKWGLKKALDKVHLLGKDEEELNEEEELKRLRPKKKRMAYADVVESTVPLEIYLVLSSYSHYLMKNKLIESTVAKTMVDTLAILNDAIGQLDRICNNPLPFAYQAHLRMTTWLYILFLPFQLVPNFGYYTILATGLFAVLLCGFMELGQEIENPFNYDLNDLDLDKYCESIQCELLEISTQGNAEPSSYIYSRLNQPLAPYDRRTAQELVAPNEFSKDEYVSPDLRPMTGMDGLYHTMLRNWMEVQRVTRKS